MNNITITNIVKNEVTVNDCYTFKVPYDILNNMALKKDKDITLIYNKLILKCMLNKSLKSLSISFKIKKEISLKLDKEYCNNEYFKIINNKLKIKVLEYLEQKGYINDYEYAKNYIYTRNNKSIIYLKKYLLSKGIDKTILDKCILEYKEEFGLEKEKENILKFFEKNLNKLEDEKEKRKIFNKLLYKGYSYNLIKNIYNELKK